LTIERDVAHRLLCKPMRSHILDLETGDVPIPGIDVAPAPIAGPFVGTRDIVYIIYHRHAVLYLSTVGLVVALEGIKCPGNIRAFRVVYWRKVSVALSF